MRTNSNHLRVFCIYLVFFLCLSAAPYEALSQAQKGNTEVEMEVRDIVPDRETGSPILILEDKQHTLALPIFIGVNEAEAIAIEITKTDRLRPLTHDLLSNILKELKINVERVVITDLRENTYFALIHLKLKSSKIEIDSRPSDAIAIALRTDSPIYVAKAVLDKAPIISLKKEEALTEEIWGVNFQEVSPELTAFFGLKEVYGVLVASVGKGVITPLMSGDILLEIDKQRVKNLADFKKTAKTLKSGRAINITLQRSKEKVNLSFKVP